MDLLNAFNLVPTYYNFSKSALFFILLQDREFVEVDLPFLGGNGATKKVGPISSAPSPTPSDSANQSLFTNCCGKSNCCRKVGNIMMYCFRFLGKRSTDLTLNYILRRKNKTIQRITCLNLCF